MTFLAHRPQNLAVGRSTPGVAGAVPAKSMKDNDKMKNGGNLPDTNGGPDEVAVSRNTPKLKSCRNSNWTSWLLKVNLSLYEI